MAFALPLLSQTSSPSSEKAKPGQFSPEILILGDRVVEEQWPELLALVNPSPDWEQIEPGQCVRFVIAATGDNRDQLLRTSKFGFELTIDHKTQTFPAQPAQILKQIKPDGGDFVLQALEAGGIPPPDGFSSVSVAGTQGRWCAPDDLHAGKATLRGTAILADGRKITLKDRSIDLKSFATARKHADLNDASEFNSWLEHYYAMPDPAQLLPALRILAAHDEDQSMWSMMSFFIAALKDSPPAADEMIHALPADSRQLRLYAIPLLNAAGYSTNSLTAGLSEEDKSSILQVQIPNEYDLTPDRMLPQRMDMLWSEFFATGRIKPIKQLVSMLGWRRDYEDFLKLRDSGQRPLRLTDSIMRGAVYRTAGWSLKTNARNHLLLMDYIAALKTSPETPEAVRTELATLYTNPTFDASKSDGWK